MTVVRPNANRHRAIGHPALWGNNPDKASCAGRAGQSRHSPLERAGDRGARLVLCRARHSTPRRLAGEADRIVCLGKVIRLTHPHKHTHTQPRAHTQIHAQTEPCALRLALTAFWANRLVGVGRKPTRCARPTRGQLAASARSVGTTSTQAVNLVVNPAGEHPGEAPGEPPR